MRNNLIWHWGNKGGGSGVECGAKVNLVNNFYSSPNTSVARQEKAIIVKGCSYTAGAVGGLLHTSGNYDADQLSFNINSVRNKPVAFRVAPVTTSDAAAPPTPR